MAGASLPAGLEPADLPADAIEVGRIADAWGIKGWFKVLPHSASPEALFSSKRWYLLPTERGAKTFAGTTLLRVREAKEHSGTVVAQAQDVDDRTAAEALKGARIFVPRSSFPTAATDEFYWVDLIGLSVVNREGVELGRVKELLSTGPQTVLVIEYVEAGKPAERMIPFVAVYVDSVDLAAKRIAVDWQADY
jgi:16S rRNA processing protein RimM